jgi:hypothetical protein
MKKIIVELSNERLITPSGLTLVGAMVNSSGLPKAINKASLTKKRTQPQIKNGDIALTYIALLSQGKPAFESVREMDDDPEYYEMALGVARGIPSAETLRQRMNEMGTTHRDVILQANVNMFKHYGVSPSPLANGLVPVDIDVTPFDNSKTSKEGVSKTYKGYDGFAPIMSYMGAEGYLVNNELRTGSQHSQKGTPDYLRETLAHCHELTREPLLVRMDSGNDAAENLGILIDDGSYFVIKRNPRRGETAEGWLAKAKDACENISNPREGKTVYLGTTYKEITWRDKAGNDRTEKVRIVYEIIERTIDSKGQILLVPELELGTWWTNLDYADREIIELYQGHAESEQYHGEIKSDMDVERLPSGKFETNALVLLLTILAYNILRMIGQESLRKDDGRKLKRPVRRRRLRTVIGNLIQIAGHVKRHGRRMVLALGRSNVWRHPFMRLYERFA